MVRSKKRHTWRLVIDASVTSSASLRSTPEDPTPRLCRELLETVLAQGHRMVLSPPLHEEWRRHRSQFSASWLTSMFARKQVEILKPHPENEPLSRRILATAPSRPKQLALEKDLLLVEAAFATDRIIVSRDEKIFALLCQACREVPELSKLFWGHPVHHGTSWLKATTPPPALRLSPKLPESQLR